MNPDVWLNRQPIPKLRTTLKHLYNWTNQDLVALANEMFNSVDLNNKQIQEFIKKIKLEPLSKAHASKYLDISTSIGISVKLKPNTAKLADTTHDYVSKGVVKTKHSSLSEAARFAIKLIQDSKVPWETAYESYLESRIAGIHKTDSTVKGHKRVTRDSATTVPLPDNATDAKKYWGLQVGDKLEGEDGSIYVITSVKPTLDSPPTVTYEKLELPSSVEA